MERFVYNLSNELSKRDYVQVVLYVWETKHQIMWGKWHEKIQIRQVPYSRYYQKIIAKIFYYFWSKIDSPNSFLINFLYHGESVLPKSSKIHYVLHSPASLIKHRYIDVSSKLIAFKNLNFIAVSEGVKAEAHPYFNSIPIKVIHHGLELSNFQPKRNYFSKNKLKIVTVAALESWKGIQHIISCFSNPHISQNFTYDIIGEGPYESILKKMVTDSQIETSVKFLGRVENVESMLPSYDIYCQLSEGEAFGISVIEAMACGLPTIVSDSPPFDKLFSNEVMKVSPNSIEEIIQKFMSLESEEIRKEFGVRGQQYVHSNFSIGQMAIKYFETLNFD